MASDYAAIRVENERRYGTDIGRIGPMLLADRYADRTHFIFEVLQNAEDALRRRAGWRGSRSVAFRLKAHALEVHHFGKPFDLADVRGICGIAETTKDPQEDIGRFGIGFKSVYAYTDRPEIHSGAENFAVESFVWPVGVPALDRDEGETVILIPLRDQGDDDHAEIAAGFGRLGPTALLFLRQIEEINWSIDGGSAGLVRRESIPLDGLVRRVRVVGQKEGEGEVDEAWLVFSRPVVPASHRHVEIAFLLSPPGARIQRVARSHLVVFFPTMVETHVGFLVQGPYRTTPSRDNVRCDDPWNQDLVGKTGSLLQDALRWLRDNGLLDTEVLNCLPLDPTSFGEHDMFGTLFELTKEILRRERLLPRFESGHVAASDARLARSQELRELLPPARLADLFGEKHELQWVSGDVTQDRTPELFRYLTQELDIPVVGPDTIVPKLDAEFLSAQPDSWIAALYQFMNDLPGLRKRLEQLPLARLENGTHVAARAHGRPQAFLPGPVRTGFPTVRASVCATDPARAFLRSLGLTEADPVDDVILNVLPGFLVPQDRKREADYEVDVRRILDAFSTDSKERRETLTAALRETPFVMAVDAKDGSRHAVKPGGVYLATDRLKDLFSGVGGVVLVDDSFACLRGDAARELLEACGAVRYLRPFDDRSLSWQEKRQFREQAGHAETSGYNDRVTDWMLVGLQGVLESLQTLASEDRRTRASLLWEELGNLEERRGKGAFSGEYTWTHYGSYRRSFDAAFVRLLNQSNWVPDADCNLNRPELVLFDSLGWKPNPFLQSKIRFKPLVIEQLAREAGIEPGVLDLLRKHGVTSVADVVARLGITEDKGNEPEPAPPTVDEAISLLLGGTPAPTPPVTDPAGPEPSGSSGGSGRGNRSSTASGRGDGTGGSGGARGAARGTGAGGSGGTQPGSSGGARPFISYVAAHPETDAPDPDGLDQTVRMQLEAQAIELILASEPQWQRTETHNPGFDLFEPGQNGEPQRWCEVKAMSGGLHDRPVGLSHTQFALAQQHGAEYWLYVVEHAGTDQARIIRIQDPAGRARTFTFDHGWLAIAQADMDREG